LIFFTYSVVVEGDHTVGEMTKRFSEGARRIITAALLAAKEMGHSYVGSEHILLAILREENETVAKLLYERGVSKEDIRKKIIGIVGLGCKSMLSSDDMTPVCRRIILRASFIAGAENSVSVGIEHLLMSLLREECVAVRLLLECAVDIDELQSVLEELYCENEYAADDSEVEITPALREKKSRPTPLLDANALDLTEKAKKGLVDPVIGRAKEEERMIAILLRRSKNNPCLVGEAGVGKTAIVESLAARIVNGKVPDELKGKRIMSLELSMVVAGTKYRGEFEEKIKNILDEVKNSGDVILFIDELHTVVGAGGAEGAIDASNILKPALARGEIRLIGATTLNEFHSTIEKDKALTRRFQQITVSEPSRDECIEMLSGLKKKYEAYHGISIDDKAITAAVTLSMRYINDRSLPDKAIDLIDEAAADLKMKRVGRQKPILTEFDIARATEIRTGIPLSVIGSTERERLVHLEDELKNRIIGQDEAIDALCSAVRRSRIGIRGGGRPSGSFLFVGKAGIGKTECAKTLAAAVFFNDKAFIRLDMSEFSEAYSVSKLIGSPPGYVGFGDGGALTEKVRRNPYSLVLFDEIEKAHPDVRALLLQILDEGTLTDSMGITVHFDNTIIIMTANSQATSGNIGFGGESEHNAKREAGKLLTPELSDRVDEIILFSPLGNKELCAIAESRLDSFCKRLDEQGIKVEVSDDFVTKAVNVAASQSARAVTRTVLRLAEEAVSGMILGESLKNGDIATLCIENNRAFAKIKQNTY